MNKFNYYRNQFYLFLFVVFLCLNPYSLFSDTRNDRDLQTIIHLLDYISSDYPSAVNNGVIINEKEYMELKEFSKTVNDMSAKILLPNKEGEFILSLLSRLQELIQEKGPLAKVDSVAKTVKDKIINVTGYQTAPITWPNSKNGSRLFIQNCIQCHDIQGNGIGKLAAGLTPAPTNFLDDSIMSGRSPFQAFNTIRLGITGTAMQAYPSLTDEEVWDLAFYIHSLRLQKQFPDSISLEQLFEQARSEIPLNDVATLTDNQIIEKLGAHKDNSEIKLRALRLNSNSEVSSENSLRAATDYLTSALTNYREGNKKAASQDALAAYLEGVEPSEARLKSVAPELLTKLEQQMHQVRQAIAQDGNNTDVENEINIAISLIWEAELVIENNKLNYWLTFILSASIMLREGLEAFLIILLILVLIRSAGVKMAKRWVHGGWVLAIVLGIGGWFLSGWIIRINGQNREIMEGFISVVAVIILAFAGLWLHNHSKAEKWKTFIKEKIGKQLQGKKLYGLGFFSFMVVFREAFEVILFLQALNIESAPANKTSIGFGVLAAFGLIALLSILFLKYAKRIPVRQLFLYSSWGISFLAIILLGKGIHSFQESGWLPVTKLPFSTSIDWLGIYPTCESMGAQSILTVLVLVLYFSGIKKTKTNDNTK